MTAMDASVQARWFAANIPGYYDFDSWLRKWDGHPGHKMYKNGGLAG
ncbi:MAG: hypothetical protein V4646_12860 [Pseudomonadota bacterium]